MEDDRTATAPRGAVRPLRTAVVFVAYSPDRAARGAVLALTGDEHTVCRGAFDPAGLTFADPHLSRRHADLCRSAERWEATDRGSHNGTFLNGGAVTTATLADGDVLRCGGTLLVYRDITGEVSFAPDTGSPLLGKSLAMSAVRAELDRAAAHDAPALIDGESGVGKELAATHIATCAKRRNGKLVALNCATLTRDLAESELFGHGAGAFTGAQGSRDGLFVRADGGTLFLDEIGEMPLELQAKLLRVLSTGTVRAVGSDQDRAVDVRVIAATNRSLPDEVEHGRFRGDLYARLAAWTITIPPLRERREDVIYLAARFTHLDFTPDAAEALVLHEWPYNVRELQNALSVATARAGGGPIDTKHLPVAIQRADIQRPTASPVEAAPSVESAAEPDAAALQALLSEHRGNVRKAADALGRDRRHLYRLLEKHGIDPDAFRRPSREELVAALEQAGGSVARAAAAFDTNRRQIYRWLEEHGIDVARFRS